MNQRHFREEREGPIKNNLQLAICIPKGPLSISMPDPLAAPPALGGHVSNDVAWYTSQITPLLLYGSLTENWF